METRISISTPMQEDNPSKGSNDEQELMYFWPDPYDELTQSAAVA